MTELDETAVDNINEALAKTSLHELSSLPTDIPRLMNDSNDVLPSEIIDESTFQTFIPPPLTRPLTIGDSHLGVTIRKLAPLHTLVIPWAVGWNSNQENDNLSKSIMASN